MNLIRARLKDFEMGYCPEDCPHYEERLNGEECECDYLDYLREKEAKEKGWD